MAGYDLDIYQPSDFAEAVSDLGAAFSRYTDKLHVPFFNPRTEGSFACRVTFDGEFIALASFTLQTVVKPYFNENSVQLESAFSHKRLSSEDVRFINGMYDSIQDLLFSQRCSIVFTTNRPGWLKRAKAYGFHYIGTHPATGHFCYERS